MENIRFAIAAGETKTFERGGRYLEIIEASGPLSLYLSDQNGGRADTARDVLSGTYMGTAFGKFEVYSATAQTVELFISDTAGGTKRQPGNVRIIDNAAQQSAAGLEFWGSAGASAHATLQSIVSLRVPAGNARSAAVKRLIVSSDLAGELLISYATATGSIFTGTLKLHNKLLGGTASDSIVAAANGTPGGGALPVGEAAGNVAMTAFYVAANTPVVLEFSRPLVIVPGRALLVHGVIANRKVVAAFDFEEL